jgi:hypothetical protein
VEIPPRGVDHGVDVTVSVDLLRQDAESLPDRRLRIGAGLVFMQLPRPSCAS